MSGLDPTATTVAVTPTLMTVAAVDVRRWGLVTVQVDNLDPTQTFSGWIHRRVATEMGASTSTMPDFTSIAPAGSLDSDGNPTDSVTADIDVEGSATLELVGKMSGVGGDVRYTPCACRR